MKAFLSSIFEITKTYKDEKDWTMKHFRKFLVQFLVVFLIMLNGCTNKDKETQIIKIGAILPLTGNLAFLGQSERVAIKMAIEDINNSGGIMGKHIKLFVEDSKGDPKEGVFAAHKLADIDNVQLGLVSTSTISNTVAPIFNEKKIPLIVVCSDETIPNRYPNAVKIYISMDSEQKVMSNYLMKQKIENLSIIRANSQITEHAVNLLKEFTLGRVKIINDSPYNMHETNFKSIVTKIKSDKSEAIYIIGYGYEFPALVKAIKEMKITKKIYGNYMFLVDPARKEGTTIYEGIDFTSFSITSKDLADTEFSRKYQELTGHHPGPFLDYLYVYEAIQIWANSLKKGISPDDFPNYIRGKSFPSTLGNIMIDKSGNALNDMVIATYDRDGSVKIKWKEN